MKDVKGIFGFKETRQAEFVNPRRQSIEQTEDYAVKQSIQTKELISEMDMDMLLNLPRRLTKDGLYIAEKDIWLDDPNRRIELPKLGYYDQSSSIERLTLDKVEGCYWLQNTNPKPTGNQPYLCFKSENKIMIYYSVPSYGQPILLKTP